MLRLLSHQLFVIVSVVVVIGWQVVGLMCRRGARIRREQALEIEPRQVGSSEVVAHSTTD